MSSPTENSSIWCVCQLQVWVESIFREVLFRVLKIRNFDIYKDPAPSLAVAAIPVLTALADRVGELLKEWPDHPVLKQVCFEYPRCTYILITFLFIDFDRN